MAEKNNSKESNEEKIIRLLEENLKVSKNILMLSRKTRHWILIQKIKGWFYALLIIVPILFAIFYLPPYLRNFFTEIRSDVNEIIGINQEKIQVELSPEQLQELKAVCSQSKR